MKQQILKRVALTVLSAAALALTGCWTPPNANVQPKGQARQIQSGIAVHSVIEPVTVQSINASKRTIGLQLPDGTTATYPVALQVANLDKIKVGDKGEAKVSKELDIFVAAPSQRADAKVLLVDPSYRLLTIQYPSGKSETFKPGLNTKLLEMAPGDSVTVRPVEVTELDVEKP